MINLIRALVNIGEINFLSQTFLINLKKNSYENEKIKSSPTLFKRIRDNIINNTNE